MASLRDLGEENEATCATPELVAFSAGAVETRERNSVASSMADRGMVCSSTPEKKAVEARKQCGQIEIFPRPQRHS